MKTATSGRGAVEFNANLTGEYPEAQLNGYTKVFRGYRQDGGEGVVIENNVSIEELKALTAAVEAAGLTSIKISLRGNLAKARIYQKGE